MPPVIKYSVLVKVLRGMGFSLARQKGSHQRWIHLNGKKCTIPKHKEIAYGTFCSICEQIGESPEKILDSMP